MLQQLLEVPWVTPGWVLPKALPGPEPLAIKGWSQTFSVPEDPPARCGTMTGTLQSNVKRFIIENKQQRVLASSCAALLLL